MYGSKSSPSLTTAGVQSTGTPSLNLDAVASGPARRWLAGDGLAARLTGATAGLTDFLPLAAFPGRIASTTMVLAQQEANETQSFSDLPGSPRQIAQSRDDVAHAIINAIYSVVEPLEKGVVFYETN